MTLQIIRLYFLSIAALMAGFMAVGILTLVVVLLVRKKRERDSREEDADDDE